MLLRFGLFRSGKCLVASMRKSTFAIIDKCSSNDHDAVILVTDPFDEKVLSSYEEAKNFDSSILKIFQYAFQYSLANKSIFKKNAALICVDDTIVAGGRLVIAGTGHDNREFDDVRRFFEASRAATKLAIDAGIRKPIVLTHAWPGVSPTSGISLAQAHYAAAYGTLVPAYTPINVREETNGFKPKLSEVGFVKSPYLPTNIDAYCEVMAQSFMVTKDIGEQGPERMTPIRVAEYIEKTFAGSPVKVSITSDQDVILKEYPLMHAVNRCANTVPEHKARLIRLEYVPDSGNYDMTYYLVGKGVTIDTGGCDVKTGGHMFGMCRDKYGSAVVAGFFKALSLFKPNRVKFVGYMCMVRNSIGARAYTCDEVITARSGYRIHIYNTDAEGRLAMLDPLTKCMEEAIAKNEPSQLMTLATLTGHEILTHGFHPAIMENRASRVARFAKELQESGDLHGQPVEIDRLHPEDFEFHRSESEQADYRQGNTKPSAQTMRGHQTPAAFLIMASGLYDHPKIPFAHIDMGGCQGDHPEPSVPNPLIALIHTLITPNCATSTSSESD